MILRKLQWVLLCELLCSIITVKSQNERSYDTSEWIPITPNPNADSSEVANKATGRVLTLDTSNQKFFPEQEQNHRKRNPNVQQYLRESPFKPNVGQKQKNVDKYRFEVPLHAQQSAPRGQYLTNQELPLATYERPPPLSLEKPIATRQQAPPLNAPNLYEQYNLPFNNSFYESLNPSTINQELQSGFQNPPVATVSNDDEKQAVQLLYVPLESLRPGQRSTQLTQDTENIFQQVNAPRQENQIYNQNRQHLIDDIEHDLIQQTVQAHRLQQQIHLGRPVVVHTTTTTTTTPKPTKRKPHQPPLAVYLESNKDAGVDDVLEALKDAKTIAVQDAVLPNSPSVFVGPSNINLPSGYTRFTLPYINKLDGNRIERKTENLPFFVAPLSYKTPPGYSKIPLPSPHVGSVVVSNKEDSHKRSAARPTSTYPNQIKDYESTKPAYSVPNTENANSQIYDPLHNTYYSTTPFYNPNGDAQKPYYLQFNVNDNVKQFAGPSTPPQGQLQQPQPVVNNAPQVSNTPVNSYKSPEPSVSYNQPNANPQTTLQQTVPDRNSNHYSTPVKTVEDPSKYSFNQNQNTQSYQISSRPSSSVGNTNHETINSYQIPTRSSAGISQYSQQVDDKKEQYSIPQTVSNENPSSYHIPSSNLQKSRHPTTTETQHSTPTRPSTSYFNEPSSSFLSSPFANSHEVSITPKTTTTAKPTTEESYKYSFGSGEGKQNPLDLAINQYELHQINSQLVEDNTEKSTKDPYDYSSHFQYDKPSKEFDYSSRFEVEKSKVKGKYDYSSIFDPNADKPKFDYSSEYERYSSTPATILRDTLEEVTTTPRPPSKSRRRGKPTRQPARTTTTAHPHEKETYTVLEEFSAKPASVHATTEAPKEIKYESEYKIPTQVEGADVPANGYRIRTTTSKYEPATIQYDNIKTVIEDIPANVYTLNVNQNTPVYTNPTSQQGEDQNQKEHVLQGNLGGNEAVSHPPSFVQSPLTEVTYVPQYNENPVIEPLVQNRGEKPQENPYNFESKEPDVPDYTSNLQDQSVRTLLVPNLLVPTTEQHQTAPQYETPAEQFTTIPTTTTTTTEPPRTTHATRARSRQRGGSRFSTASATTVASVPRRNVNRRRPVHPSRTTTESPSSQYSSREDVQKVNTRQRFRTRTRPSQTATERISSTENEVRSYKEPTSETPVDIQTDPTGPQSYIQFENTVEDQKVIIQSEDTPVTDYPQYYSPQLPVTVTENPRHLLQYENTATTQNPIMDIQITHPAPKIKKQPVARLSDLHLQAGGVLHNNNHNNEVSPPRQTTRVRGRGRSRARVATTTTERPVARTTARPVIRLAPKRTTTIPTTTTTPKTTSKAAEEFFGFIRQPNFNQIYNIQVPSATQQPIQIYQNPNQPSNTDVRVSTYQVFGNANKNPNVRVQSFQIPQSGLQQTEDIRLDFNSLPPDDTTVHFVGEIRPKYRQATQNYEEIITATESTEPVRTETPRPRIRGRARIPQRKSSARPSDNEVSTYRTQQATRRSNVVRTRGRGNVHYRTPESVRPKEDRDADVEGGNYPPSFFQNRQAATTNPPSFQISIGPNGEDDEGDQLTNPSLYQPKIVPRPEEWTEATGDNDNDEEYAPVNQINDDIHIEGETVSPDETTDPEQAEEDNNEQTTDQPVALPVTASEESTTKDSAETYLEDAKAMEEIFEEVNKTDKPHKGKGRRRGVWKLVKQRPIDTYEVAESQNYYSVVNAFGDIVKVKDKKNSYDNSKDEDSWKLGHHQLYNNYNPVLEQNSEAFEYESKKLPTTEHPDRTPTKYYEVHDLNAETENTLLEDSTTVQPDNSVNATEQASTTVKGDSIFDTIYEMFGIADKSNETTTAATTTAVSSTESDTTVPVTTTVISPTFPEEITEIPTTAAPLESSSSAPSTSTTEEGAEKTETTSPKNQITRTYDVEPWEMRAVRTSTSTEISHETEICYRGRCVKSTDRTGL